MREKEYLEFVGKLRAGLLYATGLEDDRIVFVRKGEYPDQENKDRLLVEFKKDGNISDVFGFYTRDLFEDLAEECTINEIVEHALDEMERIQGFHIANKVKDFSDYKRMKSSLFIRLLNLDKNREKLQDAVYEVVGDIALAVYLKMGKSNGILVSMKVKAEMLKDWEMSKKQIFERALYNTYLMSPPRFYIWDKLIENPEYDGENFMDFMTSFQLRKDYFGNCLSTSERVNGAVAVFLPGVADRICNMYGGSFYIVFTSIHEAMIHSAKVVDPEDLQGIFEETVRRATLESEILTKHIYLYDQEKREFLCVR